MTDKPKGADPSLNGQRLFVFSLSMIWPGATRRLLTGLGWKLGVGLPPKGGLVGVWGRKSTARRGIWAAKRQGANVVTFEDAMLRSVLTGRQGAVSHGVIHDGQGVYFDTDRPNDLRDLILAADELDDVAHARADKIVAEIRRNRLSKYNDHDPDLTSLPERFVLLIDQTLNDASITCGGASSESFDQMLEAAKLAHPDKTILIKTHPETAVGQRLGHFGPSDAGGRIVLWTRQTNPWDLFDRAEAVYTVTSQMGFEAMMAGHSPVTFGRPFYAGFGLSDDQQDMGPLPKRAVWQIAHALFVDYSAWASPYFNRPSSIEDTIQALTAQTRLHSATRNGVIGLHMRLWKRGFMRRYLNMTHFAKTETEAVVRAKEQGASIAVWASKCGESLIQSCANADIPLIRVEDGFLRSAGLGAELVRPLSLALDDIGIYYDPRCESRLERLIKQSVNLPVGALERAETLRQSIRTAGLSKYNLGGLILLPDSGTREKILIPGQVEDDASILSGTQDVCTNLGLVQAARAAYPSGFLIYKPHPDVQAGLRKGGALEAIQELVDHVVTDGSITDLLDQVDRVATMTSLTGFEALLRDIPVTCFGAPFYAGWGLSHDMCPTPDRRANGPSLQGLVHATLIDYPTYWDPLTQLACPPEVVVERFAKGQVSSGKGPFMRIISKAQGALASFAPFWRR